MGLSLSVNGAKIKFDLTDYEMKSYDFTYSVSNSKYAKGSQDERYLKITGDISRILEKNKNVLGSIRNWAKMEYTDESYYNWVKITETYRENVIREITFPDAFIHNYSEEIDPNTGHGKFVLLLMQKVDKRTDIIIDPFNEKFPGLAELMNPKSDTIQNEIKQFGFIPLKDEDDILIEEVMSLLLSNGEFSIVSIQETKNYRNNILLASTGNVPLGGGTSVAVASITSVPAEPVTIGHVYIAEGIESGKAAAYIGSTGQEIKARVNNHKWKEFITAETTNVTVVEVKAKLNVAASNRKTLRSARNEALRVVEQEIIIENSAARKKLLNMDEAATAEHMKSWKETHSVTRGETRKLSLKDGIRVGVFAAFLLVDIFIMYQKEKRSKYVYSPYLLEDEGGIFTLNHGYKTRLTIEYDHHYYKNYVSGPKDGELEEIDKEEFNYWKEEAHALWGYLDFWGNFVPGILRPELSIIEVDMSTDGII